jgi:transcriptional regulator GlxA family with amidase domain
MTSARLDKAALPPTAASGSRQPAPAPLSSILAAAGLLDGVRATTHWQDAAALARRYPGIDVDPNVLYVDNDSQVLTSAGLAAGLDMCQHMVSSDHGAAVAAATARRVVVPLVRDGARHSSSLRQARPSQRWRASNTGLDGSQRTPP